MAGLHKGLEEYGVGSYGRVKSCKAHRAEVSVILCEAEMAQVRALEIPDLVTYVVNIKLEQSVSRRSSPGKTQCLTQWLDRESKVQAWMLNRLRAHAGIQAACERGGICESEEDHIHRLGQRNLPGLRGHGTGFK